LELDKEVAVRDFPSICFTATIEFWSTPVVFLESGNLMQQL